MASNPLPAVATLFLLLLTLTTADTDGDLVLDVEGNPLEVDSQYYIQPGPIGFTGGLGRSPLPATRPSCPLYAIQYPCEVCRGDPVKIIPVNDTQKEIHLSSEVQIDTGFSAFCRDDGLWRFSLDPFNQRAVVVASGRPNVPRTKLKIKKVEGSIPSYKFTYSPSKTSPELLYLYLFPDVRTDINVLGLTDDPTQALQVLFFKYTKDVVAAI